MRTKKLCNQLATLAIGFLGCTTGAGEPAAIDLFNGTNLDGWVNVNCDSGTWSVQKGDDGIPFILCSGVPTGVMRTAKMYENFKLELDWMHESEPGNAGLFIWSDGVPAMGVPFTRSIEVQIMLTPDVKSEDGKLLYTGQGDVFAIHGATMTPDRPHPAGWNRCLPSSRQTKGKGQWNHYEVLADNGRLTLSINGVEVSGASAINPRKGYICLESEGTPIRFRNLRLTPLPDSVPALAPSQIATPAEGYSALLTTGLTQWREAPEVAGHWKFVDGVLAYDGHGADLWSNASWGDFELIADWRWKGKSQGKMVRPQIGPDGANRKHEDGTPVQVEIEEWDSGIFLRGNSKSQVNMWNWPVGSGEVWGYRTDESMPESVRASCTPVMAADAPIGSWNRFHITMRGETLVVELNGKTVLPGALLPGVPSAGPIALQHHGSAMDFMNIYVRPLTAPQPAVKPSRGTIPPQSP